MPRSRTTAFTQAAEAFLDEALALSVIEAASLWRRDDDGWIRLVGSRPSAGLSQTRIPVPPALDTWISASTVTTWRISDEPVMRPAAAPEASTCLLLAAGGKLLAELHFGATLELTDGAVETIGHSLGTLVTLLAAPAAAPEVRHVDLALVDSVALGDEVFIREILQIALTELADGWRGIERAARDGQVEEIGRLAHRLRSTARAMGSEAVDEAFMRLEKASADPVGDRSAELQAAAEAVRQVCIELERILDRMA